MAETTSECQEDNKVAAEQSSSVREVSGEKTPADSNGKIEDKTIDDSNQEPSADLLEKIRKQVEFYFGDTNMQRDKFLIEQTRLDEGWIPMTVMLNFKLLASLSKNIDAILRALEGSDLIEVSDDKKKIRRSPDKPLPTYNEEYRKTQEARTVYLKGFPLDSTFEVLKNHFDSVIPDAVESLIMRKYKKGKESFFKGSIFLQFKDLDGAKAFIQQESVKYNDKELIKMWSAEYAIQKEKEKEEIRLKKSLNRAKAETAKEAKDAKVNEIKLPKGCIMHFSNVPKDTKREPIKEKLIELEAEVAYVDFNIGDVEGWIRLQGENSAVEFMKKLDSNTIKINDTDVVLKLLEGQEEEEYLKKTVENMLSHKTNRRNDKGRGGRKGFKRRHSPHRHGNAKAARVEN